MRPDVICLTRGGISRMGCAHASSGHRPHCSPLLVDAISCSCKARQARALSKCSWSGCHTASAGTRTDYVWTLSHKLTKRGHIAWSGGLFIAGWKEWWQTHDGDNDDNHVGDHRRWWWWWWSGWWIFEWLLNMLYWWYAAVFKDFIKFDLHKQI